MALESEEKLTPHGKTIADVTDFFLKWVEEHERAKESRTVADLVDVWFDLMKNKKDYSAGTIDDLRKHRRLLKKYFGTKKIILVTPEDIETPLAVQPQEDFGCRVRGLAARRCQQPCSFKTSKRQIPPFALSAEILAGRSKKLNPSFIGTDHGLCQADHHANDCL